MNQDDLLGQLRDIHLPESAAAAGSTTFAVWPFIVLAVTIGVILILRYWNRNRWRRMATRDLEGILRIEDPAERWRMLLAFASSLSARSGRAVTLPDFAFRRPEALDDAVRVSFVEFLSAEIRR